MECVRRPVRLLCAAWPTSSRDAKRSLQMISRERVLDAATMVVVACTVTVTAVFLYRQVGPDRSQIPTTAASTARKNRPVTDWRRQLESGHKMGPDSAALRLVYYGDFECPACRRFASIVERVRQAHPEDLQVVFRHYPLEYHRFAYASSRAAECAAQQGRFEAMYHALYATQDSLGLVGYQEIARRAAVPDLRRYEACTRDTGRVARVERDLQDGMTLKIPGTPAVILDGVLILEKALSAADLERGIGNARRARP